MDVGNLISGSSAISKSSLYIGKFLVHVALKPGLKDFEHYFASLWNEQNCAKNESQGRKGKLYPTECRVPQ